MEKEKQIDKDINDDIENSNQIGLNIFYKLHNGENLEKWATCCYARFPRKQVLSNYLIYNINYFQYKYMKSLKDEIAKIKFGYDVLNAKCKLNSVAKFQDINCITTKDLFIDFQKYIDQQTKILKNYEKQNEGATIEDIFIDKIFNSEPKYISYNIISNQKHLVESLIKYRHWLIKTKQISSKL